MRDGHPQLALHEGISKILIYRRFGGYLGECRLMILYRPMRTV
jgi:hypothetical protein